MRRLTGICALALLACVLAPGTALAATPRWPSAQDIAKVEPGVGAKDAACIARFYNGRLTRKLWYTPYYKLTRAAKVTTDAGVARCMTKEKHAAWIQHELTLSFGKHAELACVARGIVAQSQAERLALTSEARAHTNTDRIFRACNFIAALYGEVAQQQKLTLTPAERKCTNTVGSANPLRPTPQGKKPAPAALRAMGQVFDRCVGRSSEEAMWRRQIDGLKPAAAIPCVARKIASTVSFVVTYTATERAKGLAQQAVRACLLQG